MKKLLLAVVIATLSGCATIDAYFMARFDNNEYALVNNIRTTADLGLASCGTPDAVTVANQLYAKSTELKNYSASIPHNDITITMTQDLLVIAKELSDRYAGTEPISPAYCRLKLNSIAHNAETIQTAIGAKPR